MLAQTVCLWHFGKFLRLLIIILILLEVLHFESNTILHLFKSAHLHELSEWVQLLDIEKGQEIVAEPPHFRVSIG